MKLPYHKGRSFIDAIVRKYRLNVIAYRCPKCGKELLDVEIPERAFQDACDQEICINTACGC